MNVHDDMQFHGDIVAGCDNGYVSLCYCCQEFNVTYKNLLLVFTEDAIMRFFEWLITHRNSLENYQPLPHGRNRIYSSPHSNLYLFYNAEELDELQHLFAQVQLVLEARRIAAAGKTTDSN